MVPSKILLALALVGALGQPTLAQSTPAPAPTFQATLAPLTTAAPVQVVTVGLPEEATRTLAKVQASFLMADNMAAAGALTRQTPKGQPLPYQKWFGVSKTEYEQALAAKPQLSVIGPSTLKVTARAGGRILLLEGGTGLESLTEVQIDLKTNTIRTPWGTTSEGTRVEVNEEGGLGPHVGYTWTIDTSDFMNGNATVVTFTLIRLAKGGQILVNYKANAMRDFEIKQATDAAFLLPQQQN